MNGQLWESCYCGTEPVCAQCMNCERHCSCGTPKMKINSEMRKMIMVDTEDSMPHPAKFGSAIEH